MRQLAAILALVAAAPAAAQEARIQWRSDFDEALAAAKATGRNVIIRWALGTS